MTVRLELDFATPWLINTAVWSNVWRNAKTVFFKRTCIYESECTSHLSFVYSGECIEKCPSGFVYFPFPSCASQLALSLVGVFMFAILTALVIFYRHDVHSIYIHCCLVWQILILGKDICKQDQSSNGCSDSKTDFVFDLDTDRESKGEDETELIHSDRMRLFV